MTGKLKPASVGSAARGIGALLPCSPRLYSKRLMALLYAVFVVLVGRSWELSWATVSEPEYDNVPYAFIGCTRVLSLVEVKEKLLEAGIPEPALVEVIELLLWFGVLGIYVSEDEERYSYQCEHERKGAGPKNGKCRQRR